MVFQSFYFFQTSGRFDTTRTGVEGNSLSAISQPLQPESLWSLACPSFDKKLCNRKNYDASRTQWEAGECIGEGRVETAR